MQSKSRQRAPNTMPQSAVGSRASEVIWPVPMGVRMGSPENPPPQTVGCPRTPSAPSAKTRQGQPPTLPNSPTHRKTSLNPPLKKHGHAPRNYFFRVPSPTFLLIPKPLTPTYPSHDTPACAHLRDTLKSGRDLRPTWPAAASNQSGSNSTDPPWAHLQRTEPNRNSLTLERT